jgi:hypothetical protein
MRVEIQSADEKPIEGFGLKDCKEIIGDRIAQVVHWKAGPDISRLATQPVRLRFTLKDANLFSLQFINDEEDIFEDRWRRRFR